LRHPACPPEYSAGVAPAIPLKNSGTHKTRKNEVPRLVRGIFVFMGREGINFQVERVMFEYHKRNPDVGGILFTSMFLIGAPATKSKEESSPMKISEVFLF